MPIENEFKFVLKDFDGALAAKLEDMECEKHLIEQYYLAPGVRVRSSSCREENDYTLTFKRKIDGDTIEVETSISYEDFSRLKPTAERSLVKTRYKLTIDDDHWDIDFFGEFDSPYFLMAECETHASVKKIPPPPDFLSPYVIYVVGKEKGFSSNKLCDVDYASKIRRKLEKSVEFEFDNVATLNFGS